VNWSSAPGESHNRKLGFAMGWDDLPRIDVDKSSSHHLSQTEIASDNPCSQHLSGTHPTAFRNFSI
jgi:hypothetical protein